MQSKQHRSFELMVSGRTRAEELGRSSDGLPARRYMDLDAVGRGLRNDAALGIARANSVHSMRAVFITTENGVTLEERFARIRH